MTQGFSSYVVLHVCHAEGFGWVVICVGLLFAVHLNLPVFEGRIFAVGEDRRVGETLKTFQRPPLIRSD